MIRIGMIGLDTSHVVGFTSMLNDPSHETHVPGGKVVAAFKGGSSDVEASYTRVDKFTAELQDKWGVEIVDSIPQLCEKVDAIMLESVDGRSHLEQAKPVIEAGLPVFIDKPMAASLADAIEIARLARKANVPVFSASSLRFTAQLQNAFDPDIVGNVLACDAYSPCSTEPHHPDLFWYGIHGVEILYTAMGRGCVSVTRTSTPEMDVVVGKWEDGRTGTFRGIPKNLAVFGCIVFGTKSVVAVQGQEFHSLVREVIKFFETKTTPVPVEDTLEILAFMEMADRSKEQGGVPVAMPGISLD